MLYSRYSSHNQKDISIEQQFEKGYELAAEYGITVVGTMLIGRCLAERINARIFNA